MSEEFGGALPSAIMAERALWPPGFLEEIIEARAYAATKAMFDQRQNPTAESTLLQLVKEIEGDLGREAYEQREREKTDG